VNSQTWFVLKYNALLCANVHYLQKCTVQQAKTICFKLYRDSLRRYCSA